MEGLRKVGDPNEYAKRYHEADELLYIDTVASLYGRNNLSEILRKTTESVFIPVTVGGGIRCLEDVQRLFGNGADKVAINTGVLGRPELISEIARRYGSQAIAVSVEAKRIDFGWECYSHGGRERTGRGVVEWVKEAQDRGCGEIILTSVDCEGTMRGMDIDLIGACAPFISCPFVVCGGVGGLGHITEALEAGADAIGIASVLHFNKLTIGEIREHLEKHIQNRRSEEGRNACRPESRV